jgi:hypothetical protein
VAQFISFAAVVPPSGFRWIYKDPSGTWQLAEPPEDWPQADYEAACDKRRETELSHRFFLAASSDECFFAGGGVQDPPLGNKVDIPDLYLSFASERATPRTILNYANEFGLLRFDKSKRTLSRKVAANLEPAFPFLEKVKFEFLNFYAEPASAWLREFEAAYRRLEAWAEIKAQNDPEELALFLAADQYFFGGQATFALNFDRSTSSITSGMMASSLADMLRIQFANSIAAKVLHRQCRECGTWFSVHPSSGRPEKEFCSNACRMRAYRRRHGKHRKTSKSRRR